MKWCGTIPRIRQSVRKTVYCLKTKPFASLGRKPYLAHPDTVPVAWGLGELHDIEVEYAAVEDMQLSNDEMVIPSIPKLPSQEILTTSLSQMSQPSLLTSATNKEYTPNTQLRATSTPKMRTYKLRRGKRQVSASAKAADSLIQQSELKRQILNEQHEWEREKLMMEKEKFSRCRKRNTI
ncbi:hypothetical protein AVEN_272606-1 [Araneus ventricosus]|uniref:Uncharacterized protein n=1 Tax=Araneus ventricosus TaxID=182803 RepID=A0A4Y2GH42_ARAVE|nr:hypothetical protein AVEN_272606-1 [Araneus ventricosus]